MACLGLFTLPHRLFLRAVAALLIAGALSAPAFAVDMRAPPATLAVHPETLPSVASRHTGTIDAADWAIFKHRFIRDDGQLVDSFSQLSHSEGQGYALLLALAANDRPTFDRVWAWTRTNLKRDGDALLAWKWKPDAAGGERQQQGITLT